MLILSDTMKETQRHSKDYRVVQTTTQVSVSPAHVPLRVGCFNPLLGLISRLLFSSPSDPGTAAAEKKI